MVYARPRPPVMTHVTGTAFCFPNEEEAEHPPLCELPNVSKTRPK